MKRFKKIITYLFEKYCFNDWAYKQQEEEIQKLMKQNNCSREELDKLLIDIQNQKYDKIFNEWAQYWYEKWLEERIKFTP